MRILIAILFLGTAAFADDIDAIAAAAKARFPAMPPIVLVDQVAGNCGADDAVETIAAYCTTRNQILLAQDARARPEAAYVVAHLYGHAAQVQHGVADVALSAIRSRPEDEVMLRTWVELQDDCIAGFLWREAGLPEADLTDLVDVSPLNVAHWGRDPLRIGPVVSVAFADRAAWFATGQAGDLTRCAPGEFTADLLVAALRS